jgi:hypothetical protein
MTARSRSLALAIASTALVQVSSARGADREACFSSAESAQQLRKSGHLRDARDRLNVCAQPGCPASVQSDCVTWLAQVGNDLPTIIVQAHDASGNDLSDVRVLVDGVTAASRLEGKPIEIDPGRHELRIEREGVSAVSRSLVAVAGQKGRVIDVELDRAAHHETPAGVSRLSVPVLVLGGVGAAALVATGVFWVWGRSDYSNLQGSCSPSCNPSDVSGVRTKLIVGDVALGVGVVSLGLAAWLFFTHRQENPPPAPAAQLVVKPQPGGGLVGIGGRF